MQIEPAAGAFAATYARGAAQVVWTTLVADLETPVSAFLKTGADKPLSFLLESVEGGAVRGRYSIIGLDPDCVALGTIVARNSDLFLEPLRARVAARVWANQSAAKLVCAELGERLPAYAGLVSAAAPDGW